MNLSVNPSAARHRRILIVEDDHEMSRFLSELLIEEGCEVEAANDGPSALEKYQKSSFDLVITDLMMPRMKGTELVRRLKAADAHALILLITAFGTIESAVEAMHAGAFHYITKPFRSDELLIHVQRAFEQRQLRQEIDQLRSEVQRRYQYSDMIGRSPAMKKLFETLAHIRDLAANVLILGESGTGKEMVARALHANGSRASGPFVAVNCAAIPETLIESELFGYVRGAFTDARKDRTGLFQEANGGVLFLDEIGEVPVTLQAKLLRVIEDREVRPLGGNKSEKVDVHLISASNRLLEELVQDGRFRQDLYYRLNVIRIDLPPLRERVEDIPLLVDHFIEKFALKVQRKVNGIEKDALALLVRHPWPGNVRELEHTIERAVLLGRTSTIGVNDLPPQLRARDQRRLPLTEAVARSFTLRDLEREYIERILETTNGNKTEAAKILGVDRTTLYRKLEEFKLKS
ncbi:MAG TPA: sigma-54 dependent transcriptional regulator [Candidatus Binatia bacterium]|jgi:DNA-binding NtrC family response regulator